jgi:hypothetical protein
VIEISANGASITPMMGVQVLRRARGIARITVHPIQALEIASLYKWYAIDNPENIPASLPAGMTFMTKDVLQDAGVPENEIQFRDEKNTIVAKITNLGRSRAIPIEELKRG